MIAVWMASGDCSDQFKLCSISRSTLCLSMHPAAVYLAIAIRSVPFDPIANKRPANALVKSVSQVNDAINARPSNRS